MRYALPAPAARLRLDLLDVRGAVVATLARGPQDAGAHTRTLDTNRLPAGVYTLHLVIGAADGSRTEVLHRVVLTR